MSITQLQHITRIDLRPALIAIAKALDYVGIDKPFHPYRVAYCAYHCAKKMGWSDSKSELTFYAALVHDCGIPQTQEHFRLLKQMPPQDTDAHSSRGYKTLNQCSVLKRFATPVRYHHTFWAKLEHLNLPQESKDIAAMLFLADRVDFLQNRYRNNCHEDILPLYEDIIAEHLMANSETLFPTDMVATMVTLVTQESFWNHLDYDHIETMGLTFTHNDWYTQDLNLEEFSSLAKFIANIVDAKSTFTFKHSERVGDLAYHLAGYFKFNSREMAMLYLAAVLHDVEKITPHKWHNNEAAAKENRPSIGDASSRNVTPHNSSTLAKNISQSWETPFDLDRDRKNPESDLAGRIIMVADIFQALTQKRPYRGQLTHQEVICMMQPLATQNKIDSTIFQLLIDNVEQCYSIATGRVNKPIVKFAT